MPKDVWLYGEQCSETFVLQFCKWIIVWSGCKDEQKISFSSCYLETLSSRGCDINQVKTFSLVRTFPHAHKELSFRIKHLAISFWIINFYFVVVAVNLLTYLCYSHSLYCFFLHSLTCQSYFVNRQAPECCPLSLYELDWMNTSTLHSYIYIYLYINIYMCVCVCEKERVLRGDNS